MCYLCSFFFSSRRRHTRCALVTGVQTCALPIFSREAAMRLNVFNPYTYTLETIIQAGLSNMRVMSVDVRTNEDLRPSRLVKSISSYVRRSLVTIFRVFVTYRPLFFFFWLATLLALDRKSTRLNSSH